MKMELPFAFFIMLSLAMFAVTLEARPDPGVSQSLAHEKLHCDTSTTNELTENIKIEKKNPFVEDFEPRPNISSYNDDMEVKKDKSFVKDFEPRPNISAYGEDTSVKGEKTFANDFEPRPNISVYND